jgi:LCP family protein required for cell wall assembly
VPSPAPARSGAVGGRPRPEPDGLRVRRAVTLLLLTVLVPGSAQIAAGNRRVGRLAIRVWGALVATVLLLAAGWVVAPGAVLRLGTSPVVLALLAVLLVVLGLIWPALTVDAWRLGEPRRLPAGARRRMALLAVVLVVATSWPLVAAGRRAWAAGDLISAVFSGGNRASASDGRYNVLLLGGDAGADRVGVRPDSITLASIDAATGRTVLFSLPRNLENVPFPEGTPAAKALPGGWSCGDECIMNALYQWGGEHADLFPGAADPGAEAMKQAVEGVTGLPVAYYVLVDLAGFRQIIDAMGGIDLTSSARVPIGGGTSPISGYIEAGPQHLDGYHALWYARSRQGSSDYERMARQRCVMSAMVGQLDPATLIARFQDIAAAGKQVVSTDIPAAELPRFIELGTAAKTQPISSVQFVPPLVKPAFPDFAVIRTRVEAALQSSRTTPATTPATAGSGATRPVPTDAPGTGTAGSARDGAKPAVPSPDPTDGGGAAQDVRAVCTVG